METPQDALIVITAVLDGKTADLHGVLKQIGSSVASNPWVPFPQLAGLHFARWVLLEGGRDAHGEAIPPSLVFCSDIDVPLERYLDELVRVAGKGLDRIYCCCAGYPPSGSAAPEKVVQYLLQHRVIPRASYVGTRGRSVEQIRREAALHGALEAFLDQHTNTPGWRQSGAKTVYARIKEFVQNSSNGLAWAITPLTPPALAWRVKYYSAVLWRALAEIPRAMAVGLSLPLLRRMEEGDAAALAAAHRTPEHAVHKRAQYHKDTRLHRAAEDHFVQNQLTHVVDIKPGRLRWWALNVILTVIHVRAAVWDTQGNLGGVPSIHFCHWTIIDGGRRLLFTSSFDGSWDTYLDDFIDYNAIGITGIWSNTAGYPATRYLLWLIDPNVIDLKAWVRAHQVPTQVWYTAYHDLTVQNIDNDTAIRAALSGPLDDAEATATWLRRL